MIALRDAVTARNQATGGGVVKVSVISGLLWAYSIFLLVCDPQFFQESRFYVGIVRFGFPVMIPIAWVWGIWSMPTTRGEFEALMAKRFGRK